MHDTITPAITSIADAISGEQLDAELIDTGVTFTLTGRSARTLRPGDVVARCDLQPRDLGCTGAVAVSSVHVTDHRTVIVITRDDDVFQLPASRLVIACRPAQRIA